MPDVDDLTQDFTAKTSPKIVEKSNAEKLPTPKLTEDDYHYFPLNDLTSKEAGREFELFLKDPRNVGLNYNFVKKYSKPVRAKFLEKFVLGDSFKKALTDFGVDLQKADSWFSQLIKEGSTFSLWEIHNNFIKLTGAHLDLLEFSTVLQIELETIHASFELNEQANFDHLGSRKNQHIGEELQNRIDHLAMFASQSENYKEISSHYFSMIFAVSIWMSRGVLLISDKDHQGRRSKYQLTEIEHRKLSILFEGVNLKRSFIIEGQQVNGSLTSGLTHVNSVFEVNGLVKVQSNIESIFMPYLNNKRIQIQQNGERNILLLNEFDQRYSNLEGHKRNFEKLELSINELLNTYEIKVNLKKLYNRGQLARFLAELAKKNISPKDFDYLLDSLQKLVQTRLFMMSEIIGLNKAFTKIYDQLQKVKLSLDSRKIYLREWIDRYNKKAKISNRVTYQQELQNLFRLWKNNFPDLVVRFNVAFQNKTSKCLQIFEDINLKDIRVDKSDNQDVFSISSTETSPEHKRMACLLNYELDLREQYSQDTTNNLFDDGFQSVHYNLENLALEYSLKSSMGSTSPDNRSIYGLVHDLMKQRTGIVDISGEELQPFKSDVEEVLKNTLLPLERQPLNSRGEYAVKLPTGILHSLSGELSDDGNSVNIIWEKPVPSPTFFGTTLGICLGDSWLKSRNDSLKGRGSLEFINELSNYMPKQVAMTILARRALLYKFIKLRHSLLSKQLIGHKSNSTALSEKDSFALKYVDKMSKRRFITAKPIHPVKINHELGSTWVGFGYGFTGNPTGVRPLVGQAELSSIFHWEAVPPLGRDKEIFINPILDFNYRSNEIEKSRYGPIFNLYFPIYKLEAIPGSPNHFKISSVDFTPDELKKLFEKKIKKSSQQFNYLANDKNYFVRFSDSILRSGLLLMDAFQNHQQHPPGISWKQKDISPQ